MAADVPAPADAGPLLIGGMHRSGTSFTASLFAAAGLDLGSDLLGATPENPRGHFEDTAILDFHIRALTSQGLGREGYVTRACDVPPLLEPVARRIVAARIAAGRPWGWKEPRTTLFLDFWQRLLPEARHVFVFRSPWEVVDSIFRRGDTPFVENPTFALDVWAHYNRTIVDFVRRHPDRCAVFDIAQVIADPSIVMMTVRDRLGMPLVEPETRFEAALFHRDDESHRAAIVRAASPAAWQAFAELRALAGLEPPAGPAAGHDAVMAGHAMAEWSRASRAEAACRSLHAVAAAAAPAHDAAHAADTEPAGGPAPAADAVPVAATEPLPVAEPPAAAEVVTLAEAEAAAEPPSSPISIIVITLCYRPWRRLIRGVLRPFEAVVKSCRAAISRPEPDAVEPAAAASRTAA